jgi:hypothetical protein
VIDAALAQPCGIQRRVQAVRRDTCRRVDARDALDEGRGQARRRVHRQIKRDERRDGNPFVAQLLARGVDAIDINTRMAQPRGRRGQAERLAAEVVGRNQKYAHQDIL